MRAASWCWASRAARYGSTNPWSTRKSAGVRQEVAGRYVMKGTRQVGFRVAAYDPSRPLIIDPVLVYSTYLGGSDTDRRQRHRRRRCGQRLRDGRHGLDRFPDDRRRRPDDLRWGSTPSSRKLNATGSALVYSTYLGGSDSDHGLGIAVDGAGSAYVTGETGSHRLPDDGWSSPDDARRRWSDAFVTKLNATGSALVYSTYLGGSRGGIGGLGIAVDGAGSAYVTATRARPISRRPQGPSSRPTRAAFTTPS